MEQLTVGKAEDTNFLNCLNDVFLFQQVQNPTRGSSILDLVMKTEKDRMEDLTKW